MRTGPAQSAARLEASTDVNSHDRLLNRIAELETQVVGRDRLLSIANRELRNPMHALAMQIVAVQTLATSRGDQVIADRLGKAHANLHWFLRRATLFLDVSRVASGLYRLELGSVDLREVIRRVADLYSPQAKLSATTLHVECLGLLNGRWDGAALEQILGNLVSNAIKFGAGSPVLLAAADSSSRAIEIKVSDQGAGISSAVQRHVFGRFEDVMLTTDPLKGGFGVGLWLARELVEAHGGQMSIRSTPGCGSTFTISLPKARQPSPRTPCPQ